MCLGVAQAMEAPTLCPAAQTNFFDKKQKETKMGN